MFMKRIEHMRKRVLPIFLLLMTTAVQGKNLDGTFVYCGLGDDLIPEPMGWEFTSDTVHRWGMFHFPSYSDGPRTYTSKWIQEVSYNVYPNEIVISFWSTMVQGIKEYGTLNRTSLIMDVNYPVKTTRQCEVVSRGEMIQKFNDEIDEWKQKREDRDKERYPDRKL